ncbi:hypothetical protein IC614_04970 [Allosphingosinicella flava]|uniref:Uncharacterized protein n=1 Tax=Allosphingosinicella flava TaxID=2771430 RepID=A0A7T2GL95_9SPHN|nr:hypothetical protein [Sphingosinicella flava]QPQ55936.1 hypothetical protein IC614_04970 [Sphingosinicella flava]
MSGSKQIGIDVDVHRLIEQNRLSFSESENDILRRLLIAAPASGGDGDTAAGKRRRSPARIGGRVRGNWAVVFGNERIPATNLKNAYYVFLRRLAEHDPDFLPRFGAEQSHSRRYVAQVAEHLYGNSPHLARTFACTLVDGWYYDSNLSADQVAKRARVAARLCGLHYGLDVKIVDNFREI